MGKKEGQREERISLLHWVERDMKVFLSISRVANQERGMFSGRIGLAGGWDARVPQEPTQSEKTASWVPEKGRWESGLVGFYSQRRQGRDFWKGGGWSPL